MAGNRYSCDYWWSPYLVYSDLSVIIGFHIECDKTRVLFIHHFTWLDFPFRSIYIINIFFSKETDTTFRNEINAIFQETRIINIASENIQGTRSWNGFQISFLFWLKTIFHLFVVSLAWKMKKNIIIHLQVNSFNYNKYLFSLMYLCPSLTVFRVVPSLKCLFLFFNPFFIHHFCIMFTIFLLSFRSWLVSSVKYDGKQAKG